MEHRAAATLGRTGERLALEHYERLGFELVARNARTPSGELDLIVADRDSLVFVEVKTARAGAIDPLDSLTARKRRRVRRAAGEWLARNRPPPGRRELRFDAVAVVIDRAGRLLALEQLEAIDC
ncbi:MAG TPA: YraN family protein [Solirubrobacteraceae bacterium]|nr:YraN family protein [Solirubrobacteraceae bacterium]